MTGKRVKEIEEKQKIKTKKILPISIIIFIILVIIALFIILNKGKIGGYSLVKIETDSDDIESVEEQDKLKIEAEKKYLASTTNEEIELSVLLNDEEVDIAEVEFTSSNEDVIEVENGIATAISEGNATITATKDDLEATIELHAIIPIKSITFTATNSTIKVGKSLQMKLVTTPSGASISTLKYTSSDEEIATVNANGIVTGVSPGKVTITVTDIYTEKEKSVNLTIKK